MTELGIISHLMATALDELHDASRDAADGLTGNATPDYAAMHAGILQAFDDHSAYFLALTLGDYTLEEVQPAQGRSPAEHLFVCPALHSPIVKGYWGFDGSFMLHMGRTREEAEDVREMYLLRS